MSSYFVRIDGSTANNPSLNLTGASSFRITFLAQTPGGDPGDLFLDPGADPDTVVQIGSQTYSFTVNWIGTLPTANSNGANQVPADFRGDTVMRIAVQDYPSAGKVTYLVFMPYENATAAQMNAFGNGRIALQNLNTSPAPVPVCYAAGTLVEAASGPVPVERLRPGDLVRTRDDGLQPVTWAGATDHRWPGTDDRQRPVRIPAGALGGGLPRRDPRVSPQHRVLIAAGPGGGAGRSCTSDRPGRPCGHRAAARLPFAALRPHPAAAPCAASGRRCAGRKLLSRPHGDADARPPASAGGARAVSRPAGRSGGWLRPANPPVAEPARDRGAAGETANGPRPSRRAASILPGGRIAAWSGRPRASGRPARGLHGLR